MAQQITAFGAETNFDRPNCLGWQWREGSFVPCEGIPLTDRAFRYGMSLFESILVRRETPIFLLSHISRVARACEQRGFPIPQEAFAMVEELLRTSGVNGFARVYVTAGDGGVTDPPAPRVFVFVEPRAAIPGAVYEKGYALAIEHRRLIPFFPGLKTGNYWLNIEALSTARRNGADEALLFSEKNILISACMANVFLVKSGVVRTPALTCGARDGVIREWVMRRESVEEAALSIRDIEEADEIFLTSSWIGIMPVHSLDGHSLASRDIAWQLHGAYQAEIAATAS